MARGPEITATSQPAPPQPAPPIKHEELFYAIARIDDVQSRLDGLIDRVQGNEVDCDVKKQELTPCNLAEMLSCGASTVNENVSRLQDTITKLEELLF